MRTKEAGEQSKWVVCKGKTEKDRPLLWPYKEAKQNETNGL